MDSRLEQLNLQGASFVALNENSMSLITVVMNADNGGDEATRFTATNELLDYVTQNWKSKPQHQRTNRQEK